ncbi:MAG: hypothetical protein RLY21_2807 [Planctomycetota bacterium]|jgi:hypothetical protein
MSRARVTPEKRHRARLLAGAFFREPRRPRGGVSRAFLIAGGIILVLIGVALVVLPVVPGFPLVIIGVLMIAAASSWARKLLNTMERRLPTPVRARLRRLARKEQETIARHVHISTDAEPGSTDPIDPAHDPAHR